jgi:predicted secreted protein
MANGLAGFAGTFEVSTNDSTYYEVDGIKNVRWPPEMDMIDDTAIGGSGHRTRIAGLSDISVSIDGNYRTETDGQGTIRTAFAARTSLYVRYTRDGTNGGKVLTKVSGWEEGAPVDGAVPFSASFAGTGAVSSYTVS